MATVPGPDLAPLEAARRLAGRPGRFLLNSAGNADGVGRWSFAGADPVDELVWRIGDPGDPFARLGVLVGGASGFADEPVPLAVGWLGYDLGRAVERLPSRALQDTDAPDLWFGRYRAVWRHDAASGRAQVVGEEDAAAVLHARLSTSVRRGASLVVGALEPDTPAAHHLRAVARALEYIRAGDVVQVNLARRLRAKVLDPGDPLWLMERTAAVEPVPFGSLIEGAGATVLSNSPELFLRRGAGSSRVETRPIKGTRRTDSDSAELLADPKERAEHLMIVDLERNDLGRVARLGTVTVEGFGRVLSLATVHHLVSTVACELREDVDVAALLRATFPGGSITGAPKVRAMEIIDELEPTRRGIYTGAIGWVGANGALDLAIAIRTAVVTGGSLALHVGGGIVADSLPSRELEETEEKAATWYRALG